MDISAGVSLVTGGASGLGRAAAEAIARRGGSVVIADRNAELAQRVSDEIGGGVQAVGFDVTDPESVADLFGAIDEIGTLRVLVNSAGGGRPVRVLDESGRPGDLKDFNDVVRLNLSGSYDVLRQSASRMAANDPVDGERGVCVMTSSIAAFDGQAAQVAYAASKSAIVGLTLPAARDLSRFGIRVATIAPGYFDTAMLTGLPTETKQAMADAVPQPSRLGRPAEFASAALLVIENGYLNGTTFRLDGAIRLGSVETQWGAQLNGR